MNNTNRAKVWESFMKGRTRMETMASTGLNSSTVSKYYCDFEIASIKTQAENNVSRLAQIGAIEAELFRAIAVGRSKDYIDQLSINYVKFKL